MFRYTFEELEVKPVPKYLKKITDRVFLYDNGDVFFEMKWADHLYTTGTISCDYGCGWELRMRYKEETSKSKLATFQNDVESFMRGTNKKANALSEGARFWTTEDAVLKANEIIHNVIGD